MTLLRLKFVQALSFNRFYQAHNAIFGANQSFRTRGLVEKLAAVSRSQSETFTPDESVSVLIDTYRAHGYKYAQLDPLNLKNTQAPESLSGLHGAKISSLQCEHLTKHVENNDKDGFENLLRKIYCGGATLEASHVDDLVERNWLYETFESLKLSSLSTSAKLRILEVLSNGEQFDVFTAAKFPTVKRYGGEGAESMLVFCDSLFSSAVQSNIDDVVVGIAHRGRNNLLTVLLQCPPVLLFRKMKGLSGGCGSDGHFREERRLTSQVQCEK